MLCYVVPKSRKAIETSLPLLSAGADVFAGRALFRPQTYSVFKEPPGIAAPGRGVKSLQEARQHQQAHPDADPEAHADKKVEPLEPVVPVLQVLTDKFDLHISPFRPG